MEITTTMGAICLRTGFGVSCFAFSAAQQWHQLLPQSFFRQMGCPGINHNYRKWSFSEGSLLLTSPVKPIFPFPIPVRHLKIEYFMVMPKVLFLQILFFHSLVGIPQTMLWKELNTDPLIRCFSYLLEGTTQPTLLRAVFHKAAIETLALQLKE